MRLPVTGWPQLVEAWLGAEALVIGRISNDQSALILAAKAIDVATGATTLVMVARGGPSQSIYDTASELSPKIGSAVLHRSDSEAGQIWMSATIRGIQRRSGPITLFSRLETAYVIAIDGRAVPPGLRGSRTRFPNALCRSPSLSA
jgi:hypothetical protein